MAVPNSRTSAPGRPWKAGQSGNPKGRPKEAFHVRDLARAHTEEAIQTLVTIMRKSRQDKARAEAARALLDRGWGKPIQETRIGSVDGGPVTFTLRLGNGNGHSPNA